MCLVDAFTIPTLRGEMVTSGTVVEPDASRIDGRDADVPHREARTGAGRALQRSLPAGEDLALLVEGCGLAAAGAADPEPKLRGMTSRRSTPRPGS